ncbi:MAG TPA: recombination protein NinB [Methanosarcina sp.]|nr:recombination protein NinB [Methanosarcina sp.]
MPTFRLINKSVALNSIAMINQLPCDGSMEVVIKPYKKLSSHEQRKRMFGYIVGEIAAQGWLQGRQFSVDVWHEFLKAKFLPESFTEGITLDGYVKHLEMPDGSLKMIGSTTMLTAKGHAEYVTACEAWAAQELGVRFSAQYN